MVGLGIYGASDSESDDEQSESEQQQDVDSDEELVQLKVSSISSRFQFLCIRYNLMGYLLVIYLGSLETSSTGVQKGGGGDRGTTCEGRRAGVAAAGRGEA